MKVGIIGAGNIGGTIARKLAQAGYDVRLAAAEGVDFIAKFAEDIGAKAVAVADAGREVDVLILSIPFIAMPDVAGAVKNAGPHTVVIDTSNYYPMRDGNIAEVDSGRPESVWASEQIGRPVIKTFNAALAFTLAERGSPRGAQGRLAMPVAGDDVRGKAIASELVDAAGFDPLDAGDLAGSWRQQPGNPAYCTELTIDELREALSSAEPGRGGVNRDALMNEFMAAPVFPEHDVLIKRNREVTSTR